MMSGRRLAFALIATALATLGRAEMVDNLNLRFANGIAAIAEDKVITVDDVRREISPLIPQLQREARSENQRPLAGRNLVVRCLRWPAPTELEAANKRKPGLYNVLSNALVIEAGSGVEANVKK